MLTRISYMAGMNQQGREERAAGRLIIPNQKAALTNYGASILLVSNYGGWKNLTGGRNIHLLLHFDTINAGQATNSGGIGLK